MARTNLRVLPVLALQTGRHFQRDIHRLNIPVQYLPRAVDFELVKQKRELALQLGADGLANIRRQVPQLQLERPEALLAGFV